MQVTLFLLLETFLVAAYAANQKFMGHLLGFGVQKLRNFHSRNKVVHSTHSGVSVQTTSFCENVTQYNYYDAVVDNFAPIMKQKKWHSPQRYWLNKQFWGGPGYPVFVYIAGEGEESCYTLSDNVIYMFSLAQQHKALMVDVEHRYYGESMPTANTTTTDLQYLSATQALADLARIIPYVKKQLNTLNSKVITFGGSYAGNLAAWFRLKYPSITLGSISSSGPLLAKTNFTEYMDVVGQAMIYYSGQSCYNAFQSAANTVAQYAAQGVGSSGMTTLETDFQSCFPMSSTADLHVLLSYLLYNVGRTIQYNGEQYVNVTDICHIMTQSSDAYSNFVTLQQKYLEASGQYCVYASWDAMVAYLKETSADRGWVYQKCSELGFFVTADSPNQPFHSWTTWINVQSSFDLCSAIFDGWNVSPEVGWTNDNFGALDIAGTNIVFASGTIDPWHSLGITNNTQPLSQSSEVKVDIEGVAHCHDLLAPAPSDPPTLIFARQVIASNVNAWLNPDDAVTPPVTESSSSSSDRLSTGAIVGIVLGAAAFLVLVACILWFACFSSASKSAAVDAPAANPVANIANDDDGRNNAIEDGRNNANDDVRNNANDDDGGIIAIEDGGIIANDDERNISV